MNSLELCWHKESCVLPTGLQLALRILLKRSHVMPLPDSCTFIVLNFMRRDTWGIAEYLCSSYYHNILLYGSHGENNALDALLYLAMNPSTQTHPQCPTSLSFAQDLLISVLSYTVCVSACMYTCVFFTQHFLLVLLSIYSFFTSEIPLIVYSIERTWEYPAPLEPLGGVILLATVSPVLFFFRCSPISGCLQGFITAISNNVIVHLQQTYIHVITGSSVSCCTSLLTRKSSTVWPYFTILGALRTSVLLPEARVMPESDQFPAIQKLSDRHSYRHDCFCYWSYKDILRLLSAVLTLPVLSLQGCLFPTWCSSKLRLLQQALLHALFLYSESQNGWDLWRSSSPSPGLKQGHLKQAVQDHGQILFGTSPKYPSFFYNQPLDTYVRWQDSSIWAFSSLVFLSVLSAFPCRIKVPIPKQS